MSKPVKLEPIEVPTEFGGKTVVRKERGEWENRPQSVVVQQGAHGGAMILANSTETAALVDALLVALKAQQDAERLTFADLKPGEWFRFASPSALSGVMRRLCGDGYCTENGQSYSAGVAIDVIRLTATFTPVTP